MVVARAAAPRHRARGLTGAPKGWMSTTSAKTYEHATEVLFQGIQDVMQRQALVPVAQHFSARGRPPAAPGAPPPVFMDVACGTGRFLTFVKDNYPDFQTIGVDLSPYYLSEARQNMEYFNEYNAAVNPRRALAKSVFRQAAAEALPNADASVDVLTCVYLFHELPPEVRRECAKEFFRVLKPGGCLVLNDSLQGGDNPELDAILPLFPGGFHEPYYLHYAQDDIVGLFEEAGFITTDVANAFLSKVFAFRKPDAGEEPAAAEPGALAPEGGEGGLEKSR